MNFEGTEKKLEISTTNFTPLRELGEEFWKKIVDSSKAQILSRISSKGWDAYLLSESSLFVSDDVMTMITCGDTSLVQAALEVTKAIPSENISHLFYERKNPIFPHKQSSHFEEDVQRISEIVPGEAFRFGDLSDHHVSIFHMKSNAGADPEDMTLEILMHDIDPRAKKLFFSGDRSLSSIASETSILDIFPGFSPDQHLFTPCGYSMNALSDDSYYTFHVTPEDEGSYVSFETNFKFKESIGPTIKKVIDIFKPASYDVVCFQIEEVPESVEGYAPKKRVRQKLSNGYETSFYNFFQISETLLPPTRINLER